MSNLPALPPVMTVENITSLMGYLETKSQDVKFPSLSVFPDFLSSILRFVNERNRIWREDVQFNEKMAFARETVDKQLLFAVQKLNEQTKLQIASVQGDVQTRLARINQEYDVAEPVISVSGTGGQKVFDITGRQFSSFLPDGSAADCASFSITHIGVPSTSLTKTQEPRK